VRRCATCGLVIGETATFCPVCGARAEPSTAGPSSAPAAQPPSTAPTSRPLPGAGAPLARVEPRTAARIVSGRYSATRDGSACPACAAMDGRVTADTAEAGGWTPNPDCTSREGCRCVVVYVMISLLANDAGGRLR
jgi:hypothetical protein